MGLVFRPTDQLSGVAAIREDMLDEGEPTPGSLQDTLCPVAVLDIGSMDLDREKPAVGVGQNVPLTAVDALSGVIAFGTPF